MCFVFCESVFVCAEVWEQERKERERERDLKVQSQHIAGRSGVNTLSLLFENCYNVHRVDQTDRFFPSLKINLCIDDLVKNPFPTWICIGRTLDCKLNEIFESQSQSHVSADNSRSSHPPSHHDERTSGSTGTGNLHNSREVVISHLSV